MNEQDILTLFALFTGLSEEEAAPWAVLCRSAAAQLTGRLRPGVDPASQANRERLESAAAAMAAYRYGLLESSQVPASLKVGEITLAQSGSGGSLDAYDRLQREALAAVEDLTGSGDFHFERV